MSCCSSLLKKYLMALTGLVLVGFVLVHMVGNLQMFLPPVKINTYAHGLHSLPLALMWGGRAFLLLTVVVHIWVGISLACENRAARPEGYEVKTSRKASTASRFAFLGNLYMPVSGLVILAFIPFHILHYTVRAAFTGTDVTKYEGAAKLADGTPVFDVYRMVVDGFSHPVVAVFYIVGMVLLFAHLAHGVSSMFQSIGLRNEKWRSRLDCFAKLYAVVIAAGFIAIPVAVQAGLLKQDGPSYCRKSAPATDSPPCEVPVAPAATK